MGTPGSAHVVSQEEKDTLVAAIEALIVDDAADADEILDAITTIDDAFNDE